MNKRIVTIVLGVFLFLGVAQGVSAQTDDPILKACEQTADMLKKEQIKNAGLEAEVRLLREMLGIKDEKIALVVEQKDFYKKAYENSTKIDTNSSMVIDNLRGQVADFKIELATLRSENSKLRSNSWVKTAVGFGVGFGTGFGIKR